MHQTLKLAIATLLLCAGANARPLRQLHQLGYVPQGRGCDGLIVTVTADEDDSWGDDGPIIEGTVKLLNPKEYGFPINNIQVIAQSSDGLVYPTEAVCANGQSGTFVPVNPVPYTYGTAECSYKIQLDQRVFSSYSSSSGSSGSSGSGSGQLGYFPSGGSTEPTWTVTAVATIGLSNAQCPSAPVNVDTDSWWSWFSSWFGHNHNSGSTDDADSSSTGSSSIGSSAPLGSSSPSAQGDSPSPGSATVDSTDGPSGTGTTDTATGATGN